MDAGDLPAPDLRVRSGDEQTLDRRLGLRPLTARSVVLSLLLGSHPPELASRSLVRAARLFSIEEGALRVALSRMGANGDLVRSSGRYRLNARLVERQLAQDRARHPNRRNWDGSWVVLVGLAAEAGGFAPRPDPSQRLARLRDGVWMRPANLDRGQGKSDGAIGEAKWLGLRSTIDDDPVDLVSRLWDLERWADLGEDLVTAFDAGQNPARRFVVAAGIVRHLLTDPALPAELVPPRWPGERLRDAYDSFEQELRALLATPDVDVTEAVSDQRRGPAKASDSSGR